MTDKIKKAEPLGLLERKRKFLGLGIDLESDLESLRYSLRKAGDNQKELDRIRKQIKSFKKNLENRIDDQDDNIKQSELNIKIEEENIETAERNKEFLKKLLKDVIDLED